MGKTLVKKERFLYVGAAFGFAILTTGLAIGVLSEAKLSVLLPVVLEALGSAILFPILVSFSYDRLRERWFGDEVWRIFGELSDAGISRIYKDREVSDQGDNAQDRLANEFRSFEFGEILMMGVSLRVFLNPLGPFYRGIEEMLRSSGRAVHLRAMICDKNNPDIPIRAMIEEGGYDPSRKSQIERDLESSAATMRGLNTSYGNDRIELRAYKASPYCTAIVFPHVCYYAPNLLAPRAPVGLPMILFQANSHGYRMVRASFDYLWEHPETQKVVG